MKLRIAKKIVKTVLRMMPVPALWYSKTQISKAMRVVERAYGKHKLKATFGVSSMAEIRRTLWKFKIIQEHLYKMFLAGAIPSDKWHIEMKPKDIEDKGEAIKWIPKKLESIGPIELKYPFQPEWLDLVHKRSEN